MHTDLSGLLGMLILDVWRNKGGVAGEPRVLPQSFLTN